MGRFEAWLKICCSSQPNQCFSPMRSLQTHTTPTVIWARKGLYRWMKLFWGLCEKTHTNVHQDARTLVSLFVPFLFGTFFPPFCFSPIIFAVEHKDHFEGDPPLAVLGPELKGYRLSVLLYCYNCSPLSFCCPVWWREAATIAEVGLQLSIVFFNAL